MNPPRVVALAVSGHGFGHAVRSAEVARALLNRGIQVKVRTDAPAWLFPDGIERLPSPGWPLDIGVAQHGGLDLDIDETRHRWDAFARDFPAHAEDEAGILREHGVDVLLGDIPPLAFAAAAHAHIPSLALTTSAGTGSTPPGPTSSRRSQPSRQAIGTLRCSCGCLFTVSMSTPFRPSASWRTCR